MVFIETKLLLCNPLFKNIPESALSELLHLDHCIIGSYKKGTVIIQEGDACSNLGFILSGSLAAQQISTDGEILTMNMYESTDTFGAALLGTEQPQFPFTLVTTSNCKVLYIPFYEIRQLLKCSPEFNENYIAFLSSRVLNFKEKLKMLQYKDVRSRIIYYLSKEFKKKNSTDIILQHSKVEIANILGIARPSLSRELKHMSDENILQVNGNKITLLKPELFFT